MFGSPLLGTAIGLALLFTATSLLCSGITETLSNLLQLRAKYLLTGMRALLDGTERETPGFWKNWMSRLHSDVKDKATTEKAVTAFRALTPESGRPDKPVMTTALFDNPLLAALQSRRVGAVWRGPLRNPQYVSGRTVARALIDLLVPADPGGPVPVQVTIGKIRDAVQQLPPEMPARPQLLAFLARAGEDVDAFELAVEQWYDEQMAKISGWYKRWSRVVLGIVGFLVALFANIDTVQVAHALYVEAPLQQAVESTASAGALCETTAPGPGRDTCVRTELGSLQAAGIPLGYVSGCAPLFGGDGGSCWSWSPTATPHPGDFWLKLLGWILTAFAVSFGAPFWFEALSRLGSLRNAGTRPAATDRTS